MADETKKTSRYEEEIPEFDILTGGFPCQSFSIVAQNGGNGKG